MLVEDCPQESFPIKSLCEVETWEGEREAEEDQVCQRQHPRRNWNKAKLFFSLLCKYYREQITARVIMSSLRISKLKKKIN